MIKSWIEKYRPKTFDEYVWKDSSRKMKFQEMISQGALPSLLLTGGPGTGKTSLAKLMLKMLDISESDIMIINASLENGIETIREKVNGFASSRGFGDMRYVLLDEADCMSPSAQMGLRNLTETYEETCRFILTCNYPHKIIPALKSRCQNYHFDSLNQDEFFTRAADILIKENIDFDAEVLMVFVEKSYPDMRKMINNLQQFTLGNKLTPYQKEIGSEVSDGLIEIIDLISSNKINSARKKLNDTISVDEYDDLYKWLYNHIDLFGNDDESQGKAVVIIAKGLRNHALSSLPEINLSACLYELHQHKNNPK